jgi:uncharacterized protein
MGWSLGDSKATVAEVVPFVKLAIRSAAWRAVRRHDGHMTDDQIAQLLRTTRVIAVVGLSSNPERPSNQVAWYLHHQGYRLYGVNPNCAGPVFGVPVVPDLASVPEPIDLVNVFRRPSRTPGVAREAVAVGAGALWLQLGIRHPDAAAIAAEAGLAYVENRCIKVDHGRLVGSAV